MVRPLHRLRSGPRLPPSASPSEWSSLGGVHAARLERPWKVLRLLHGDGCLAKDVQARIIVLNHLPTFWRHRHG